MAELQIAMMARWMLLGSVLLGCSNLASEAEAGEDPQSVAADAVKLLGEKCMKCHGEGFRGNPRLDFSDFRSLLSEEAVVPGDAEESLVFQRIRDDEMPENQPFTESQKDLVRRWIDQGARLPETKQTVRQLISMSDELSAVRDDLTRIDSRQRQHYRYITLRHLQADDRVTDEQLDRSRAALSKMVNSLSTEPVIVRPSAIGSQALLFRLDLRDYGWNAEVWSALETTYPFGLRQRSRDERDRLTDESELAAEMRVRHVVLRGDWFVDAVARPAFYHRMLRLPDRLSELETQIGVNESSDVRNHRVARAGFASSGVSVGHRMVQRHRSRDGYYWKSYDFADDSEDGNLFRRPFGPAEIAHHNELTRDFPETLFRHDGGEMIFSLPNGLQGYFLTDANGKRLDRGPIAVVRDNLQTGGTAEVVNAVSCLGCHARGMIHLTDSVRRGHTLTGELAREVDRLYVPPEKMQQWLDADGKRFAAAADLAMGGWSEGTSQLDPSTEPIGWFVRRFNRDLDLATAAAEVGVSADRLQGLIENNESLQRLGLNPLSLGERIKRSAWSNREAFISPMQETARIAGTGTPNN